MTEKRVTGRPKVLEGIEEQRLVAYLAERGVSAGAIANIMGVDRSTLTKEYPHLLEEGKANAEINLRTRMYSAALNGDMKAVIYLLETWFKPNQNEVIENNTIDADFQEAQKVIENKDFQERKKKLQRIK